MMRAYRDDNQVVGMFCFQYQQMNFFVSEVLATPKSLSDSGFKANNYYYRACGIISRPPRLRQRWVWHR